METECSKTPLSASFGMARLNLLNLFVSKRQRSIICVYAWK